MKKTILTLLVCSGFLFSCNQSSSKSDGSDTTSDNVYTVTAKDAISVKQFEDWTANWQRENGLVEATNLIEYFTMPLIDLKEVLGEHPAATRFYLGLDTTPKIPYPHLLLVGIDKKGNIMIDSTKGQRIYDVTRPCPPACG